MSEQDPQLPQGSQPSQPPEQGATGQSPPASAQPAWESQGPSGPRASFGRRFVAVLVDSIVYLVVYGILLVIFDEGIAYGLSLLFGLLYVTYLEGGPRGQTLGKMALGIRVVDFNTGSAIGYGRGLIRYIGRIISSIPLLLGYFWMLWDKEKQTWHDKLATTVVVPVQYYPLS
jgi:uncharacterized RDD family membrane protein YckC